MIEVNLIPDVKQEFINAQRMRSMVVSGSIIAMIGAGAIVVLLGIVLGTQRVAEVVQDGNIKQEYNTLQSVKNLGNLLTIQNQLGSVSKVNDEKVVSSRLFDVMNAINPLPPNDIRMSTVTLDPGAKTITIEGLAANSFTATDILTKTITRTNVEFKADAKPDAITSKVLADKILLSDTNYGQDANGAKVLRFKLSFVYPDELFSNAAGQVTIVSPTGRIDATDSKAHVPTDLLAPMATDQKGGN